MPTNYFGFIFKNFTFGAGTFFWRNSMLIDKSHNWIEFKYDI